MMKVYNQTNASFWSTNIIATIAVMCVSIGILAYKYLFDSPQIPFIIPLFFLLLCFWFPISFMYVRWKLFEYDKKTTLSIDVENKTFLYKHNSKVRSFKVEDIETWVCNWYGPDFSIFVEIIDLRLKNGERIIMTDGIGDVADFFRENKELLGLPEQHLKWEPLNYYVKIITE